jgi:two-component system CheB/CheR fusion protein
MATRKTKPTRQNSNENSTVQNENHINGKNKFELEKPIKTSLKEEASFPIVGIGASAGGLAAFEAFFAGMPADKDPGMAFVLVQHLAPDRESILAEIIRRYTRMRVFDIEDGMNIEKNCVYIIPPNRNLALINGTLQLFELPNPRGHNLPIDFFFRSLAADQRELAICIILSGTGSDGTLGLREVKGEGGMVIAQKPDTAEYDGMPTSAIATGLVDYQLSPIEMTKQIISYVAHARGISINLKLKLLSREENTLKKVLILLRTQTGHDFSNYKPSTINRRIERRLSIQQIDTMDEYIKYLQETPNEVEALFKDLLIGVTAFFRDKDAFIKLEEEIIPKLFEGKPAGSNIRVWCTGCSTGEEAYSIAILFQEQMERLKKSYNLQIFATDIDKYAISVARLGIYPNSIALDISEERLSRFFTVGPGASNFSIIKSVRDMLIFSEHSLIKDPPFSQLDLISCRNLMIYLNSELQKMIIPLFHYALKPRGILFLGTSETVGNFEALFTTLDRKLKIYQSNEDYQGIQRAALNRILPPMLEIQGFDKKAGIILNSPPRKPLREITEQSILKESSMAGILINGEGDILYLHGRTGMYLEPSQGEAGINNILKMSREGLQQELKIGLHKLIVKKEIIRKPEINVKTNGHFTKVNLTMKMAATSNFSTDEKPLYIVLLEEAKVQKTNIKLQPQEDKTYGEVHVREDELRTELMIKDEYLQAANEELETSVEELKSSSEEMQSINEELQSTNEELETSKEELQSLNEELATVNNELQIKVHDLTQANNDMNNLLSGTNIATIFLDYQQNILRFTPTANKIINLISSDVGRPVAHIVSNLVAYNHLSNDVKAVLDTLIPKEIEVQTIEGRWYNLIIQPYRTMENAIEGAVVTFIDITTAKEAKDLLTLSEIRYRTLFETAMEGILILDGDTGKIKNANPFLIKLLGYNIEELVEKNIWDIGVLKNELAIKDNFMELQEKKHMRFKNLPLETANGEKIEVEFIANLYEINKYKIAQCNIREIIPNKEPL